MRLRNRVVVITGGASGIGEETAILFAKEGARVVIADIDGAKGDRVAEKIREDGGDCTFIEADVSKAKDVGRMIDIAIDHFGNLDILFNNAGIGMAWTDLEEVEEDLWDKIISVNLKSMFLASKYAVPIMKREGGGVIINTASMGAVRIRPRTVPYVVAKGGVITFTRALALELAPYNIRVNSISPAVVDTPLFRKISSGVDFMEAKKAMIETIPLGKFVETKDVAHAALYLASDEASMITGFNLQVDGGRGI